MSKIDIFPYPTAGGQTALEDLALKKVGGQLTPLTRRLRGHWSFIITFIKTCNKRRRIQLKHRIRAVVITFFRSVNALFSKIGRLASEDVFLHLVNSKCMPILLYSLEVCPLNKTDIRSLDFTVTRFLMKLFRTCNTDIIKDCRTYFCFKLPSELIPGRFENCLNKLQRYS